MGGFITGLVGGKVSFALAGVILAMLLALGGLSWFLTKKIEENGQLQEQVAQYQQAMKIAGEINKGLEKEIRLLEKRNRLLLEQIASTEDKKTALRNQLDRKNDALKHALRNQQEWSQAPIPDAVVAGVNDLLQRLFADQSSPGNSDKG